MRVSNNFAQAFGDGTTDMHPDRNNSTATEGLTGDWHLSNRGGNRVSVLNGFNAVESITNEGIFYTFYVKALADNLSSEGDETIILISEEYSYGGTNYGVGSTQTITITLKDFEVVESAFKTEGMVCCDLPT